MFRRDFLKYISIASASLLTGIKYKEKSKVLDLYLNTNNDATSVLMVVDDIGTTKWVKL
jgi:hypothetical protein